MDKNDHIIISGYIVGIVVSTTLGITAVALDLVNLYWLAFFLFVFIYTDSVRRYKTKEHGHDMIRKSFKTCIWALMVFALLGLLNTYTAWIAAEIFLKIIRTCTVILFPIEAVYLIKIKNA